MITREALEKAVELVHMIMPPTPQLAWPLLSARCGADVWVKHENHTPIGAFKLRGGLIYTAELRRSQPTVKGVIAATRGNHGQSVAFSATGMRLKATIVVPHGNSVEKNAAMRAHGAELIEHGHDFQAALEFAERQADARGLHMFPSYHEKLAEGVGSYAMELFSSVPDIDTVYVPIGLGSGICGTIAARDALGLKTEVVGVVAENAPTYARSVETGKPVATDSADTMADGLACRVPVPEVVDILQRRAARVVTVSESAIEAAMRHYFTDTHNVAEGAGAAALAALLQEKERVAGRRVALILTGGNVDRAVYQRVLADDRG